MEEPTVKIILPEPGLILFGENLPWSINKTIIIGGFTVKVNAFDKTSGVFGVRFYLDGKLFNEATEEPYQRYCGLKHDGKGTIKVFAVDFANNPAMDTLDIIYYNFF